MLWSYEVLLSSYRSRVALSTQQNSRRTRLERTGRLSVRACDFRGSEHKLYRNLGTPNLSTDPADRCALLNRTEESSEPASNSGKQQIRNPQPSLTSSVLSKTGFITILSKMRWTRCCFSEFADELSLFALLSARISCKNPGLSSSASPAEPVLRANSDERAHTWEGPPVRAVGVRSAARPPR